MTNLPVSTPVNTFIVRIWREWSETPEWRGQIEHVQSSNKIAFVTLKEMVRFIQGLVSMPNVAEKSESAEGVGNSKQ